MSDSPTPIDQPEPAETVSDPMPPQPADMETAPAAVTPAESSRSSEPPLVSPETEVTTPAASNLPPVIEPEAKPIIFHGRTDEYFRIWIVNSLLTLLTVGLFFPWAKVRKRRYLRGSTELLGHRFDYRANPVRLLFGHAVVLVLFLGYSLFGVVYPAVRLGVVVLGIVMLPWIVVRSFTFNAHNTVYRGLRFQFSTSLSGALMVYLLEPVLIVISCGFYYPAWQRSKRAYAVSNHRLGDAFFQFNARNGPFYSTYFFAGLIVFAAAMVGGATIALFGAHTRGAQPTLAQLIPFIIIYGFGFFVSRHLIYGRLFNTIWNNTCVDEHRFRASLDTGKWLGLQVTNLGAIVVSAGLLYPWALMRSQRYVASCLHFVPAGTVETIQRLGGKDGSATGDMAAEFIGLDFGL